MSGIELGFEMPCPACSVKVFCVAVVGAMATDSNPSDDKFETGRQPCEAFNPQQDSSSGVRFSNRHVCYRGCGKLVSFCLNCCHDHHEDGFDSCQAVRVAAGGVLEES
jgi:hypothetical protein